MTSYPYILTDLTRGITIGCIHNQDAALYLANQLADDNPGTTFTVHVIVAGEPRPLYTIQSVTKEAIAS